MTVDGEKKVRGGQRLRDPERTKKEILEVATEEFAKSGFAGARVDEIASRTRTTKRMIYYYFGSKERLYIAVLEKAYEDIRVTEQNVDVENLDPVTARCRIRHRRRGFSGPRPTDLEDAQTVPRTRTRIRRLQAKHRCAGPAHADQFVLLLSYQ